MCLSQWVLNSNTIAYVSAAAGLNTQRLITYLDNSILFLIFKAKIKNPPRRGFNRQLLFNSYWNTYSHPQYSKIIYYCQIFICLLYFKRICIG